MEKTNKTYIPGPHAPENQLHARQESLETTGLTADDGPNPDPVAQAPETIDAVPPADSPTSTESSVISLLPPSNPDAAHVRNAPNKAYPVLTGTTRKIMRAARKRSLTLSFIVNDEP